MLQKTMDKSPLFCGFAVVHKKGSGRIIRDGGAGGNITIMFDSTADRGYANRQLSCRIEDVAFQHPNKVHELFDETQGGPPSEVAQSAPTLEEIVQATRANLGIKETAETTETTGTMETTETVKTPETATG